MCTVKIHFVLWVAMETAIFHIAQMSFFLRTFVFHLVSPNEQFGIREKLSWRGARLAKLAAHLMYTNILFNMINIKVKFTNNPLFFGLCDTEV